MQLLGYNHWQKQNKWMGHVHVCFSFWFLFWIRSTIDKMLDCKGCMLTYDRTVFNGSREHCRVADTRTFDTCYTKNTEPHDRMVVEQMFLFSYDQKVKHQFKSIHVAGCTWHQLPGLTPQLQDVLPKNSCATGESNHVKTAESLTVYWHNPSDRSFKHLNPQDSMALVYWVTLVDEACSPWFY